MTEQGYFFVGDLMGFARIVDNLSEDKLFPRVESWVRLITETAASVGISRLQMISDTVFAAADPTSAGLLSLVRFSQMLLERGVSESLPVRGAIAFGTFVWGNLTYGKAVIAAHQLEMAQQWIGVACDPGLPDVSKLWSPTSLVCYAVPMKSGTIRLQPAIAWGIPPLGVMTKALTSGGLTRDGDFLDWEWAYKIGNTVQFRLYLRILQKAGGAAERFYGVHPLDAIDQHLGSA